MYSQKLRLQFQIAKAKQSQLEIFCVFVGFVSHATLDNLLLLGILKTSFLTRFIEINLQLVGRKCRS